jgi:hypothetical protein
MQSDFDPVGGSWRQGSHRKTMRRWRKSHRSLDASLHSRRQEMRPVSTNPTQSHELRFSPSHNCAHESDDRAPKLGAWLFDHGRQGSTQEGFAANESSHSSGVLAGKIRRLERLSTD